MTVRGTGAAHGTRQLPGPEATVTRNCPTPRNVCVNGDTFAMNQPLRDGCREVESTEAE